MSEKRHKINKFENYQNIIVRNSPALDRHVFVSYQNRNLDPELFCACRGERLRAHSHTRNHWGRE